MRAVDIHGGAGPISALFINDQIEKPIPKATECLIKVKAFGLNRADTLQRMGGYPVPPGVTEIMGLEFAGLVEEVGNEAGKDFKPGDEVFGLAYGGGYAEYVAVDKKMLVKKPKELSWEECAGTPEVWMTALQAIHLVGGWAPGKVNSILWHAGPSSVSIAGIQQSLHLDPKLKVYATTRQDAKCDYVVNKIGAHAAVNTTKHYAKAGGSEGGTKGVDLVIDYVGAPYFAANLDVLAVDGRIVMLGLLGGPVLNAKTSIGPLLMKRASVVGSTLRSRDPDHQGKLRDLFVEKVLPKLVSIEYKTHIEKVEEHWRGA
ncbi:Putative GroES-like superfamily, alcohol dehydrogenase-like, NAD(P)-binding domain superfamily [Septoria linicola]|uniref:GroES-like superfamily, alcohol dehydrogenase-like, NAD(P)-binding domain superfamily n=1 Tax=Septoria linicola TaxID=215465 RepID=A0A9Q9EJ25_9PEZI|nr:putative GroES-like superfamily, alcohol dehydrogenase-like, NAD(P)-binding domain superfamily [Septoria linicola]USW53371.1 Putative GroES-like superfamily, alcohol dehydrogenase-like, NAD(P)-binding domain superfamily [Septoria linicola]